MTHRLAPQQPITAKLMTAALREMRNTYHMNYMCGSEQSSERAAAQRDFCEDLARELGLDLGDLP
jgi:hypothetical protein